MREEDPMSKLAEVKTLYNSNARQIPEMLRKLANDLGNPPDPSINPDQSLFILRDSKTGQVNIYAWGDVTVEISLALLAIGTRRLSSIADDGGLWPVPVGGVK
jgi:hypothetical protein